MHSIYKKISELFAGLGTLLIDGDALIDYIQVTNKSENEILTEIHIDSFIEQLKKCGFDKIEIIIFTEYFSKTEKYSKDDLSFGLFKNQKVVWFENLESDTKWRDYITNEQISTLLTNFFLNSITNNNFEVTRNSYISKIISEFEIIISILDDITFTGLSVSTFLIDHRGLKDLNSLKLKANKICDSNETEPLSLNNFSSHGIRNIKLNDILENRGGKIATYRSSRSEANSLNKTALWLTEISFKNSNNLYARNDPKYKEKQNQKYYRHMENYAQSLSASKLYHHKIIIGSSQNSITSNRNTNTDFYCETDMSKQSDQQVVGYLEKLLAPLDFEEIMLKLDRRIEESMIGHSRIFKLLLRKLKLKFIKQQTRNTKNKALLCFLLKEILEDHKDLLETVEYDQSLNKLNELGFKETVKCLNKTNRLDSFDEGSFNNEIYLILKYNGDKLKRTLNSKSDPRVKFKPDEWQVKLLDVVDRNDSALVCCPTSSGKTFICYYAMEKILRSENLNDMIVFVSPNKALANQVVAEIYTRFGDRKYPQGNYKTVYAMFMQDYKINEFDKCQILVTIPTMFETLLCSKNDTEWIKNIKYVIIDEIQTINDVELTSSIEKILHLVDCPVIGLSATISNFDEFFKWFDSIERFKNKRILHKISHHERYCDLQKFLFIPKTDAIEANNSYLKQKELMNLKKKDDDYFESLVPIHEMIAYPKLYLKKSDYAYDFHLIPTEIATILDALEIVIDEDNQDQVNLIYKSFPDQFFQTTLISKNDVKEYEKFLMKNFKNWINEDVFTDEQIKRLYFLLNGKCEKAFEVLKIKYGTKISSSEWALENVFELVNNLQENKMLPAIVFTKSYKFADDLLKSLVTALRDKQILAERTFNYDNSVDKKIKKIRCEIQRLSRLRKVDDAEIYALNEKIYDLENRNKINIDDFSFLNSNKLSSKEIEEIIEDHKYRKIDKIFFEAWKRGIGVHHANFHTKYRGSTEYLFRRQHIQIVFATETLALGINMPCRTVVLTRDCLFLDTMLYRQMIGRAGRRGFDTIGNIVYFGVPQNKVKNFISSDLIKLKSSDFSYDFNNILQLSMLNFSNNENMKFVESFIKYPFSRLCGEKCIENNELARLQIMYLMEQGYLNADFIPNKLANLVLPLRLEDCNIFLVSELVRNKIFDKMLDLNENSKSLEMNCNKVINALSYFTKIELINPTLIESIEKEIILPNIPDVDYFLKSHNMKLDSFFNWALVKDDVSAEVLKSKKSYFKKTFPYYQVVLKNSYIYNFYTHGNIERIENVNNINRTSLWYAIKTMRILLETLLRYVKTHEQNNSLSRIIDECNEKMKKRFETIIN